MTFQLPSPLRLPKYRSQSITLLPQFFESILTQNSDQAMQLAQQLGVESAKLHLSLDSAKLDSAKHVVLFLIDGFGWKQWQDYKGIYPALSMFQDYGVVSKIDTVFPSSTPVALNALLGNGVSPAQHGLIDWYLYIKEIDEIIATLPFNSFRAPTPDSMLHAGLTSKTLFDQPTIFEAYAKHDITSYAYILQTYAHSVYSSASLRGSEVIGHQTLEELFENVNRQLGKKHNNPIFHYVYWGGIDATGHTYGLESTEYATAVDSFFAQFQAFLESQSHRQEVLFAVTADHGQISVNPKTTIYLDEIEGFNDMLQVSPNKKPIMPWGGARELFVATKSGQQEAMTALLSKSLADKAVIIHSKDAAAAGLFGDLTNPHPDFDMRIGDITIIATNNFTLSYHYPEKAPFDLRAHHGGLTADELEIPLALLTL